VGLGEGDHEQPPHDFKAGCGSVRLAYGELLVGEREFIEKIALAY
jgi:hypothetical protein